MRKPSLRLIIFLAILVFFLLNLGLYVYGHFFLPPYPGFHISLSTYQAAAHIHWIALPYLCWLVGTLAFLLLPLPNIQRRLIIAVNYLAAFYLLTKVIMLNDPWQGEVFQRIIIWLSLPIYLHLQWVFPKPLSSLPPSVTRGIYALAAIMAIAEGLGWLPTDAHRFGLAGAILININLLIIHFAFHPAHRRDIKLLAGFAISATLPFLAFETSARLGQIPWDTGINAITLPMIPVGYFYAIYRAQLGRAELRANRWVAMLFYANLLLAISIISLSFINTAFAAPINDLFMEAAICFLAGIGSLLIYPHFRNWVTKYILGMPPPPIALTENYREAITTSLNISSLVLLLQNEILPALAIRQSALLQTNLKQQTEVIHRIGVEKDEIPKDCLDPNLLPLLGQYRPLADSSQEDQPCPWIRLALPLKLSHKQIGVWMFGQREPNQDGTDRPYTYAEIETLEAIATQVAIALHNIMEYGELYTPQIEYLQDRYLAVSITNLLQTERLQTLYQMNVERQEFERKALALELHDDVLNQLAVLAMQVEETFESSQFDEAYQTAAQTVRNMISGLRPPTLEKGLGMGLYDLADDIENQSSDQLPVKIKLQPEMDWSTAQVPRYPPNVELNIFRIAQQACQNALKHAQARQIQIQGLLEPNFVSLTIQDDGVGFAGSDKIDLTWLLTNKHFGLVGMQERGALIGANVQITSKPGHGTQIKVVWNAPEGG